MTDTQYQLPKVNCHSNLTFHFFIKLTIHQKCYKMVHFFFLIFWSDLMWILSASWKRRTNLTSSWKAWSTFIRALALHSIYGTFNCLESACASSNVTCKDNYYIVNNTSLRNNCLLKRKRKKKPTSIYINQ